MATFSNKNLTNVRGLFVGDKFIPTAIPNIKNWVSLFEELSRNPNKTEVLEFVRPCIDEGGNHVYYYVLLKVCKDDSCDGQGLVEKFFPLYVGCRVTRTDGRHHSFNKKRPLNETPGCSYPLHQLDLLPPRVQR